MEVSTQLFQPENPWNRNICGQDPLLSWKHGRWQLMRGAGCVQRRTELAHDRHVLLIDHPQPDVTTETLISDPERFCHQRMESYDRTYGGSTAGPPRAQAVRVA